MGIQNEKEKRGPMFKLYKTPIIVAVVMLFLALLDLPIGYYTLLRIVVCGTAIYLSFVAKEIKKLHWVWIMGFIGILFNPFIPIHLDKEIWAFIDIIVGFTFIIALLVFINKKKWAWIVGGAVFIITFLIFSISYFEEEQARLKREQERLARKASQGLLNRERNLAMWGAGSDFTFQNKHFKVTLLTPYRTHMRKRRTTEPVIIFKFNYEVIDENAIVYIADVNDGSSLEDDLGNSYNISQDYWNYQGRDVGKFMHGHQGAIILYTKDKVHPNATHLLLTLRFKRFGKDIYEKVPRNPHSLTSLLYGKRFVIPISSIKEHKGHRLSDVMSGTVNP
jgi:hypothetical protein